MRSIVPRVDRVVVLHSGGMSSRQWRRLVDRLRGAGLDVLAPDFRGHGEGPAWPDRPVMDFAFDVASVEALIEGPTHLVGHSYGGLIALLVARGRSDIASVCVYEPIALGTLFDAQDRDGLRDLDRLLGNPAFTDPAALGTEAWLRLFVDYWSGEGAWDALGEVGQASFRASAAAAAGTAAALAADRTPIAAYRSISAPLLILRGDTSPLAARRASALVAQGVPDVRLQTIAGAGHMGPLTHSDVVNDAIVSHIETAAARTNA
jgi:pimeloyl-ACP methyl ester carboxylesterase